MGNELVKTNIIDALVHQDPKSAIDLVGKVLLGGGLGLKTIEQARAIALRAMVTQTNPFDVAAEYHVLGNRLSMRADAMLSRFQQAGGAVRWLKYDDAEVKGLFTAPDKNQLEVGLTFESAASKGWVTDTYKKYPRAMLRARVISEAVRTLWPSIITGIYTPEEMIAGDVIEHVTAPEPAPVEVMADVALVSKAIESIRKLDPDLTSLKDFPSERWTEQQLTEARKIYNRLYREKATITTEGEHPPDEL